MTIFFNEFLEAKTLYIFSCVFASIVCVFNVIFFILGFVMIKIMCIMLIYFL